MKIFSLKQIKFVDLCNIIESPSTNLSDCSRFLTELEREALDLSAVSHNRSLNDCEFISKPILIVTDNRIDLALCRSPVMSTNAMNDTVAELRSRPYQMAHVRSATSQNGSTVVDDDSRKSDYKRLINGPGGVNGSSSIGNTSSTVV